MNLKNKNEYNEALEKYNLWFENLPEEKKNIELNIRELEAGRHWGTKLDKLRYKDVPSKYIAKSFSEIDHDELRKFFLLKDKEKFEMAYWLERINSRNSFKYGFIYGALMMVILFWIFSLF